MENIKRNISDVFSSTINPPLYCDLGVTNRCMLRCKMCETWKNDADTWELTIGDYKKVINALSEFTNGSTLINFIGGEPLIKDEILDLVYYANQKGLKTGMTTNAYLIDEQKAKIINQVGIDSLTFSLESLNEETHDYLRGVKGTHKRLIKAIEYFNGADSHKLNIATIIMERNLNEIISLTEWINDNHHIHSNSFQVIAQTFCHSRDEEWYKKEKYEDFWPHDTSKVKIIIERLIEYKRQGYKISNPVSQLNLFKLYYEDPQRFIGKLRCTLGEYACHIRPDGNVFLCGHMEPIGNIREDTLEQIWYSEHSNEIRWRMANCKTNCHAILNCFFSGRK